MVTRWQELLPIRSRRPEAEAVAVAARSMLFGVAVVLLGGIGWLASTLLLIERVRALQDPTVNLACDISPFVSCGALFDRWQASVLGFPNPVIGVAGFMVPVVIGFGVLAGATFSAWFWRATVVGLLGAWFFVTWLFVQSVFEIGVLCPYCLVVWAATIPLWWLTLAVTMSDGHWGRRAHRAGAVMRQFIAAIVVANYAVVAIAIVVRFPYLFVI